MMAQDTPVYIELHNSLSVPAAGTTEGTTANITENDSIGADSQEWERRVAARLRQIMIGKARPEYRHYVAEVPREWRTPQQPHTPDPRSRISKRQFDRVLGEWRRQLHEFDTAPWLFNNTASLGNLPPPGLEEPTQMSVAQRWGGDGCNEVQDRNPRVIQLLLAEQFPEQEPLPIMIANQVLEPEPMTLADKVPDPVLLPQARLALRVGPQAPADKMPPPSPFLLESLFPEEEKCVVDDQTLNKHALATCAKTTKVMSRNISSTRKYDAQALSLAGGA